MSQVAGASSATERRIKVLDFGLAKLLSDDRGNEPITRAGMLLGTPMYISPEQCTGAEQVTPSADIYALGCILYEMLCGRAPFEREGIRAILAAHMFEAAPHVSERVPTVPAWLDDLVVRMMAKKPEERPSSMAEVAEALATAGHEDAGLTWLMPGSATAMLPATVLPAPPPRKFPWPDLRLSRVRLPELRMPQVRLPHLSQVARHLERLPRLSRVARNLRLSVIDRRVRRMGGVAIGLVALVIIGALALARGGHPQQQCVVRLAGRDLVARGRCAGPDESLRLRSPDGGHSGSRCRAARDAAHGGGGGARGRRRRSRPPLPKYPRP